MNFFKEDINKSESLALSAGAPLTVGELIIYPLTIKEIAEVGLETYDNLISAILVNKDMVEGLTEEKMESITDYDVIASNCINDNDFKERCEKCLSMFTKKEVIWVSSGLDNGTFVLSNVKYLEEDLSSLKSSDIQLVYSQNLEQVARAIRLVSLLNKPQKTKSSSSESKKPVSKKVERLLRKREEGRKKMKEAKNLKNEITLTDIYNIVGVYTRDFNKINDWTLYQLYSAHSMFMKQEDYKERFEIFLAGGEPDKLQLDRHWSISK